MIKKCAQAKKRPAASSSVCKRPAASSSLAMKAAKISRSESETPDAWGGSAEATSANDEEEEPAWWVNMIE